MEGFIEISSILGLATLVSWVMHKMRQPLILGHIITGIIAGPIFLNLVASRELLDLFSKIGITALLFIVGMSLSPKVTREVGKISLIAGTAQVIFTFILAFGISLAFGFDPTSSMFIGIALTFSSTIIVLKLLADKKDLARTYGKISMGILLIQDVIATIILIAISATQLGQSVGSEIGIAFLKLIAVGAGIYLITKTILPALSKAFASSQEFLFLFTVAWGLGLASLFHAIGFSIEIGALVAGVTLATSPYHYEMSAKMKMIRDFFIVLFFILLGAQISFFDVTRLWMPTVVLSLFVLIGNPLILLIIMGAMGYHRNISFHTGLSVAQISEFSLVLIILAHSLGYVDQSIVALVTFVGLVTIAFSSYMIMGADRLYRVLDPLLLVFEKKHAPKEKRPREVVESLLFGCHRLGQDFLSVLKKRKRPYLVVDFNPEVVRVLDEEGVPVRYGDADDNEFLEEFDLSKLKLVVSTVPDTDTNEFLVHKVRAVNKHAIIIVHATTIEQALYLYSIGASYVILPHYLGGNYASLMVGKHGVNRAYFHAEREKHIKHLKAREMMSLDAPVLKQKEV